METAREPLPLHMIVGARIPRQPQSMLWDITIQDGFIADIETHEPSSKALTSQSGVLDAAGRLLAPSLCHAHIHLDKCFLLQDPKFSDLEIISGDFSEAMRLTNQAKSRFEEEDLLRRGRRLIESSIQYGVTSMRAFVEVDAQVGLKCLNAGLRLKDEFADRCFVQICAFAQLPLYSGDDGGQEIRVLMIEAAQTEGVDVLGSTPYVEHDVEKSKLNVRWITSLALAQNKMLDFHMDYHLEEHKEPLIWAALKIIKERGWVHREGKSISMGHCTRLTRFESEEWDRLRSEIGDLPLSFVGLPTSDLFMMRARSRPRGTLHIPEMIREYGLEGAIAVNNVGNAFTPQGSCDPLAVASLGIGVYQAGTIHDAELLYDCVSERAKQLIGHLGGSLNLKPGDPADFVLFDDREAGWQGIKSIAEAVYCPCRDRQTIWGGWLTS